MLCVVIIGPSIEEARIQIQQASSYADLVELRLDRFTRRNPDLIQSLLQEFSIPMIFTLRSKSQGGNYQGNEEERLQEIKHLAACGPAYLDLETHISHAFIEQISCDFPQIKLIISFHDFEKSSENLEEIIEAMPKIQGAFYKIAAMAHSTADALRVMLVAKKLQNLTAISMGEHGEISRILAPVFGSCITYSNLEEGQASAPGQVPAQQLVDIYRYKSLNSSTGLYGLIGNPITGSIGHLTNNAVMKALSLNAVYVKMKVEPNELKTTLSLMKNIGFRGLAVTMPLKEVILPYLDEIDPDAKAIGAVNTVLFERGHLIGYNNDGYGALESIGSVKGKKMILLGAGGAARAIAYEATRRGAHVIVLNRTIDRAKQLVKDFGCEGGGLEKLPQYDILINCIPYHFSNIPIDPAGFIKNTIVMDITSKPKDTPFLQAAQQAGCRIVHGYQMFIRLTLKQFGIWFPGKIDESKTFKILNQNALKALTT